MYFDCILALITSTHVAKSEDLVGVPLAAIAETEKQFGVKLPIAYVEFLHRCGRSAGKLADWTAIYFDDLREIAEDYEDQKNMSSFEVLLPTNAFFFAQFHTQFDFFICGENADPQVQRLIFSETAANIAPCADSFTDYMKSLVNTSAANHNSFEPFYVDDCGELCGEDLALEIPLGD